MAADSKGAFARSALIALALGVSALLACGDPAARAQEPDSVTFATGQPLTLTWSQLVMGKSVVEVCNSGRTRISKLTVVPTDFAFTRGGTSVPTPASVIAVVTPRHGIAPGACASLGIHAVSELPLDPGEYKGTLLLIAAGAGSARLQTTIAASEKKPSTPAGVAEPTTLSIHNSTPFSRKAKAVLLLKEPASGEEPLAIGKSCSPQSASDEEDCPFIGNLYQGAHVLGIHVNGPAFVNRAKHVQELPIRLQSFGHAVGAYEGTVTLTGVGGTAQSIKVKVNARDAWGWAVLALFIGTLLALLPELWNSRVRPLRELTAHMQALPSRYHGPPAGYEHIRMSAARLRSYTDAIGEALKSYAASGVLLDTKGEAYVAIDKALKTAEDDARVFSRADGLAQALGELKHELEATIDLLAKKEVSDTPAILKLAADPLAAGELGVGGASVRAKRSVELAPQLKNWRELAGRVLSYAVWLKDIDGHLKSISAKTVKAQKRVEAFDTVLVNAGVELWGVREALFEATEAADLARIRASGQLQSAFGRIAYLGRRFEVVAPAPDQRPGKLKGELHDVGYLAPEGEPLTTAKVMSELAAVEIEPAKPAKLPSRRLGLLLGDAGVLLLTISVAIVAGLSTFYFGKPFGTLEDYLTVVVVGAAAQVALKAILSQLSVLVHDISPEVPTAAARLLPAAMPAAPAAAAAPAPPAPA
jgi:hypothetical protein